MGYFDGLADASFKKDEAGNNFYYPWGFLGSGYQLESEEHKNHVRQFVKKWYMFSLPAIILSQAFISIWVTLFVVVVSYVWYLLKIKKMTQGLQKSDVKLKISESYRNSAKSHNMRTLIFYEIFFIVFIAIALLLGAKASGLGLLGLLVVTVFFGFCACAIGYMIYSKTQDK